MIFPNQNDREIIDICTCGPSEDQSVGRLQGVIGIVFPQCRVNAFSCFVQLLFGVSIRISAGRIGGPSVPSEPTENTHTFPIPLISLAAARAIS